MNLSKPERNRSGRWLVVALLAVAMVTDAPTVKAQVDPVTVSVAETGNAVPGGSVTLTAIITINDGSMLQSTTWTQVGGVAATLSGTTTTMVGAALGPLSEYKGALIFHLKEPPITADQLPPNVPPPGGDFPAGLQDRWEVVGMNPFAIEEAGRVALELEVVTSSGTYEFEVDVHTALPYKPTGGIRNVGTGIPILLQGKEQASYDWTLTPPGGSSATLVDASTQNPELVPDVTGTYMVDVTDGATMAVVTIEVYVDTWRGVIVGQDASGLPVAEGVCTGCHNGLIEPDQFTPWSQTGHAEIFSTNLDTSTHYGPGCFSCHTVGFDPDADNGGFDDQSDYDAFLSSGLLNNPGDNWTTMLRDYPDAAQQANIQCENCHGPNTDLFTGAHMAGDGARNSLSSDVCATCHGEPLRHARFQQWQLSFHANYELAIDESQDGDCSRCHTANGFLSWLPVLEDDDPTTSVTDEVDVTWTEDEVHPQTCQACHDPHAIGTSTGIDTDATVRISGDTPLLLAGFTATDVARGAICITCHNTRRGLRNDQVWPNLVGTDEVARAPHGGAQGDMLMGQNAYFVTVGNRGNHSETDNVDDTCVTCHMEETPPPDDLSYESGGTNHTFFARNDICGDCHGFDNANSLQAATQVSLDEVKDLLEDQYTDLFAAIIDAGDTIDINGQGTVTDMSLVDAVEFDESRGRQALTVVFTDMTEVGPNGLTNINVVPAAGDPFAIYTVASDGLLKAGWNYWLIVNDQSLGVHNPTYSSTILTATKNTLEGVVTPPGDPITDPGYPSFRFWVRITSPTGETPPTQRDAACISETVCISGAIPGRSEVFIRIVGPKPNGYLWPTLVKFTTSQVEIWIEQTSTGVITNYTLAGAQPGFDILEGLFDRTAFLPVAEGNVVRGVGLDPREDPTPPGDTWMSSSELPGYSAQARITSPTGAVIPTRQEAACIDETICASGAIAGRSEVFIRVVGPKPNGYMWPTLVKFSTSQVEIWIRQDSTGLINYYILEGAAPGKDELNGLFDRLGFLP